MNAAEIFEGIALLIELAQRGEIDPWDVRVIEAIDRYLNALLAAQEITPGSYESNLSQSGQAFLLASLLVLF
ncbi:segregation/condensation protein A, partial [Chroococcidiopsidales cyanobacterium LEGE 13417]|nr:segregation/condensation protein A [Chroococcidiopsidales cyanobacterium LEGE 13417]